MADNLSVKLFTRHLNSLESYNFCSEQKGGGGGREPTVVIFFMGTTTGSTIAPKRKITGWFPDVGLGNGKGKAQAPMKTE